MISGIDTRTDPAITWPIGFSYPTRWNVPMNTGTVCTFRSRGANENASRNSFVAYTNAMIADVPTPGAASGTMTFTNTCHGVAPSTLPCSSSSFGMPEKNVTRMKIDRGSVSATYGITMPAYELSRGIPVHV